MNDSHCQLAVERAPHSLLSAAHCGTPALLAARVVVLSLVIVLAHATLRASNSAREFARQPNPTTDATLVQVLGLRASSVTDQSQVFIDLSADARYKVGHLSNPERIYVDLFQTNISPRVTSRRVALTDGPIEQIRMGIGQDSVTRIVFDLHVAVRYRVSELAAPIRMLVELIPFPTNAEPAYFVPRRTDVAEDEVPITGGPSLQNASAGRPSDSQAGPSPSPSTGNSETVSATGPHTYGDAEKVGLSYAGTTPARNVFALGLITGSGYNDNVLGNNQQRVGDENFLFNPNLSLRRQGKHLTLALSYQPNFHMYRREAGENSVDQALGLDATYQETSLLSFRARTSALYTSGISQPSQSEQVLPGPGSASSLNDTLYTPTVRQLTVNSRFDVSYQASAHDSIALFVGLSERNFEQPTDSLGGLQNTEEKDAGLLYRRRLSRHATLGADYMLQDIHFGSDSRTVVHSALLSYAQQLSRSLTVSIFGGPLYSSLDEVVPFAFGPITVQIPIANESWEWAVGGSLTDQLHNAVFALTAQHQVSDGGGLVGVVVSSSVTTSVRRRLPWRWDAVGTAGYANNSNLAPTSSVGSYQSMTLGGGLERSLTEGLALRLRYDFLHQRGVGETPLSGNLDRDLWSFQFTYAFREIPLGRQ